MKNSIDVADCVFWDSLLGYHITAPLICQITGPIFSWLLTHFPNLFYSFRFPSGMSVVRTDTFSIFTFRFMAYFLDEDDRGSEAQLLSAQPAISIYFQIRWRCQNGASYSLHISFVLLLTVRSIRLLMHTIRLIIFSLVLLLVFSNIFGRIGTTKLFRSDSN